MSAPVASGEVLAGKYRVGDVRHCFGDITLARELLDYAPQVGFEDGLRRTIDWYLAHAPATHPPSER